MRTLRIATRKSPLALWQAEYVKARLLAHHPQLTVELVTFTTQGDKILDTPLAKIGGKGLFVKELEVAMLEGRADLAVHSMKDVPMDCPEGLAITVICEREDPTDAFVSGATKCKPSAMMTAFTINNTLSLSLCVYGNDEDSKIIERFFDEVENGIAELASSV